MSKTDKQEKRAVRLKAKAEKKAEKVALKTEKRAAKATRKADRRAEKTEKKATKAALKAEKRAEKADLRAAKKNTAARTHAADSLVADLDAEIKAIAAEQSLKGAFHALDNAALLFPSSESAARSNLFRLSAIMRSPVDPIALQWAVNDVVPRFPRLRLPSSADFFGFT